MQASVLTRRIVRLVSAGTVALAASAVVLLAPTSADAAHSLKSSKTTAHSLAHSL